MEANASPTFAESTPLGLLGLAIGCAALTPIAFGAALTPDALRTAAWFCLLFGGGGQFLAGLMALANKNQLGGTLFTTFSFNWVMNWWALNELASGRVPNASIVLNGQALNISVTSYDHQLHFGLTGCRQTVPHLQHLLAHLETSLEELERL